MALNCLLIYQLLSKSNLKIAGPLIALLVACQILLDIKFSCPCSVGWNQVISLSIFIVPALIACVIMLLFVKLNAQNNSGTAQAQNSSGPSENEQKCVWIICVIPMIIWWCICLIDGDYAACFVTDWDGKYACDKELHPHCLNWCKPTESNQNQTEKYNYTRKNINISKILGYILAGILCVVGIIVMCGWCRCSRCSNSAQPTGIIRLSASGGNQDAEDPTSSGRIQDSETIELQQVVGTSEITIKPDSEHPKENTQLLNDENERMEE
ncbi:uncharacterized protein LOC130215859 [Danio aesculapii]|uniref:uncharacterized protein LOC130215859 n=1 Tax=Danio aesculapii TaxID=1142201 RepID=UPI0024C06FDF|nr:uncharacterized protein LOC130215859 [Danio aesculapii]